MHTCRILSTGSNIRVTKINSNFTITRQTRSESVHNDFLKNDEVLFEYGAGEGGRVAKPGDMLLMVPFHDTRFGIVL